MVGRSTGIRCGEVLNLFVVKLLLRNQLSCLRPLSPHPGHVKPAEEEARLRGRWGRVHEALIRFDSSIIKCKLSGSPDLLSSARVRRHSRIRVLLHVHENRSCSMQS